MLWILLCIIGGFSKSMTDLTMKKVMQSTDMLVATWARYVFVLPVALLAFFFFSGIPQLLPGFFFGMTLIAIIEIAAVLLYMYAIKVSDLSLVIPMLGLTPMFIILTGYLILGETVSALGLVGLVMIFLGTYIVGIKSLNSFLDPIKALFKDKGARAMIMVAMLFSILPVMQKYTAERSDMYFIYILMVFIALIVFSVILKVKKADISPIKKNLLPLSVFGVFGFLEFITVFIAFDLINVSYALAVKRTSILFSAVFGFLIFKEKNIQNRLAGAVLVFMGILVLVFA